MQTQPQSTHIQSFTGAFAPYSKPLSSILSNPIAIQQAAIEPLDKSMLASILSQLAKETRISSSSSDKDERVACSTDHS